MNQRLPSAPTVIPYGPLSCHSSGNSVIVPLGVMRPIVPRLDSVNQRFPSGPGTIVYGRLSACGSGNSVTSARAPGARSNARPATTSVEAIHGLSTALPSWLRDESTARRLGFLVRRRRVARSETRLDRAGGAVRREHELDAAARARARAAPRRSCSRVMPSAEPLLQDLERAARVDQRVAGDEPRRRPRHRGRRRYGSVSAQASTSTPTRQRARPASKILPYPIVSPIFGSGGGT